LIILIFPLSNSQTLSSFRLLLIVHRTLFYASNDAKIANYEYFQSGDQTFSKFTLYGTNDQPYEDNPATGNNFSVDAVEVLDWDSEGKVKGGMIFYDRLTALVPPANNTILPYLH